MSDPSLLTSDRLSSGVPIPEELARAILADRLAGMTYPEIATKRCVHVGTARRVCKRAVNRGELTLEQIGATRKFGIPARPAMSKAEYDAQWIKRVKSNCVIDGNGCWIWQGFKSQKGYGKTNYRGKNPSVHRCMFEVVNGLKLVTEQFVCHRCDVPSCCNPDHLFLGNNTINMADKTAKGRHHELRVTHCPMNHPYDAENTYYAPNGSRHCKACKRYQLRLKAGWPEELALHPGRVPAGYTKETLCQTP